jgi:serine protease Do
MPRNFTRKSLGSGFIVDPNGYIVTNNHVVERASKISVKLNDGRTIDATVVGTDPQTDLAVLRINAANLPTVRFAAGTVEVGDWVLAFGSPFGLEKTMTAGIISAEGGVIGAGPYDNFLQTDAAINPGNSGGPLVNLRGEVVGVNTMIASQSGGFQGVGFAIPAAMAEDVYRQLSKTGKVTRGWLGVHIQGLTPELAKSFDLSSDKGVLVADVDPEGPAAKAGLKSGDVIVRYNGQAVQTPQELTLAVASSRVGVPSKVEVLRNGQSLALQVSIGERPSQEMAEKQPGTPPAEDHGKLGLGVQNVTPEAARQMRLSSDKGVLVTEVRPGSPAEDGGVRPGDVIVAINHRQVSAVTDLQGIVRNLKSGSNVLLKVEREGQALFLAFDLA